MINSLYDTSDDAFFFREKWDFASWLELYK